jgi:3-methyladenine DNA glycosylase Tag
LTGASPAHAQSNLQTNYLEIHNNEAKEKYQELFSKFYNEMIAQLKSDGVEIDMRQIKIIQNKAQAKAMEIVNSNA